MVEQSLDSQDDAALLSRYLGGCRESMTLLHSRHDQSLRDYLAATCGLDPHRLDDAVQNTWLKVLTKGSQFRGGASFRTWLFTIGRNSAFNRRRKLPSFERIEIAFEPHEFGSHEDESTLTRQLVAAVELLPASQRAAIRAVYFDKHTFREAAKRLKKSPGNISTSIARGLQKLKLQIA